MAAFDNLSNPSEYLAYWGKTYRNELLSNILPFWMKYGLDKENGGLLYLRRPGWYSDGLH